MWCVDVLGWLVGLFACISTNLAGWQKMSNRAEAQRRESDRALGASGATSGIVLSFIIFRPFEPLMIFLIPFFMPAVVLGLAFIVISAVLSQRENKTIGHEAHLGGAFAGVLTTILIAPGAFSSFSAQIARALGGS